LGICLCFMLLQFRLFERLHIDKKFEFRKSKDDSIDSNKKKNSPLYIQDKQRRRCR
jgi:hypothetical protein